ncbi:MAG: InlB B-repeat-containing protein, partial [Clostridia bacterium]|nr:InlB B-repeat-containing protein [Clostridia bacterium]
MKNYLKKMMSMLVVISMLLTTFCFFDIGILKSEAFLDISPLSSAGRPVVSFTVPETIYLKYGSTAFQYYVDSNESGKLSTDPAKTTGLIVFTSDTPCSSVKITQSGASSVTFSPSSVQNVSRLVSTITSGTTSGGSVITWTCTFVCNGETYETKAHTYVYSPYGGVISVGSAGHVSGLYDGLSTAFGMVAGIHSIPTSSNGEYVNRLTGTGDSLRSPLIIPIDTNAANLSYLPKASGMNDNGNSQFDSNIFSASDTTKLYGSGAGAKWFSAGNGDRDDNLYGYIVTGNLTFDSSRYTNLNQIPNLQSIGYWSYLKRVEPCYCNMGVSSETPTANNTSSYTQFASSGDYENDSDDTENRYFSSRINFAINSSSQNAYIRNYLYFKYNATTISFYKDHYIRFAFYNRIALTPVDKSALRTEYDTAKSIAVESSNSYGTTYSIFKTKLEAAGRVLGNPTSTASQVSTAKSELTTALTSLKNVLVAKEETYNSPKITFYVPEMIYLKPASGTMKEFQYYVDRENSVNSSLRTGYNTSGNVFFNCAGATNISISCSGATVNGKSAGTAVFTSGTGSISSGTLSTAISAKGYSTLTWTATFTVNGKSYTAKAYTVCYAPMTTVVAAAARAKNTSGKANFMQSLLYAFGMNEYTDNGGKDTNATLSNVFINATTSLGTFNDTGVEGALLAAASTQKNANYSNSEGSNNNGVRSASATSPESRIYVDTSRYNNFNQIPNFKLGWQATDDEDDGGNKWSEVKISVNDSNIGGNGNLAWGTKRNLEDWPVAPTKVSGSLSSSTTSCKIYCSAISCDTNSNSGDRAGNYLTINVSVTSYNKATLRNKYNNELSLNRQKSWYTDESWTIYESNMKNAAECLGKVTTVPSSTDYVVTAINALVPKKGTATVKHINSKTNKVIETETEEYEYGSMVTAANNSYDGYTYNNSWKRTTDNKTGTGSGESISYIEQASVTWEFYYTPQEFTVIYDPKGGTFNNTKERSSNIATYDSDYTVGTSIAAAAPIRDGYTFQGWSRSDNNSTVPHNTKYIPWKLLTNITFTAIWKANEYTIKYWPNGADTGSPATTNVTVEDIATIKSPSDFSPAYTKAQHEFTGWDLSDSNENVEEIPFGDRVEVYDLAAELGKLNQPGATLDLYAHWEMYGDLLFDNEFNFDLWKSKYTSGCTADFDYSQNKLTVNTTASDAWVRGVTDVWCGDTGSAMPVTAGHTYRISMKISVNSGLNNLSRATLDFFPSTANDNNYLGEKDIGINVSSGTVTANQGTLTSLGNNVYVITSEYTMPSGTNYLRVRGDVKGASANVSFSEIYVQDTTKPMTAAETDSSVPVPSVKEVKMIKSGTVISSKMSSLPTLSRVGYTFCGWYYEKDAEGNGCGKEAKVTDVMSRRSVQLYSKWINDNITVKFNLNYTNAPAAQSKTATYDKSLSGFETPIRSGYTFLGWTDTPNATTESTFYIGSVTASDVRKWYKTDGIGKDGIKNLYAIWFKEDPTLVKETSENPADGKFVSISEGYDSNGEAKTKSVWIYQDDATGTNQTNYNNALNAYRTAQTTVATTLNATNSKALLDAENALKGIKESLKEKKVDKSFVEAFYVKTDSKPHSVKEINLNHYELGILDNINNAYTSVNAVSADALITEMQATVNSCVETMADNFVKTAQINATPEYKVYETSKAIQDQLGEQCNAVNFVMTGSNTYTYLCYTNKPDAKIVIDVNETANKDGRVCYPTKAELLADKSTANADIITSSVGNDTYKDYIIAGLGTKLGANYYNQKARIVIESNFASAGSATYTFTAEDDSLEPTAATKSSLSGNNITKNKQDTVADGTKFQIVVNYKPANGFDVTYDQWGNGTNYDYWLKQFHLYRTSGGANNWEIPGWDTASVSDKSATDHAKPINMYPIYDEDFGQLNYCSFYYTFTEDMISGFS